MTLGEWEEVREGLKPSEYSQRSSVHFLKPLGPSVVWQALDAGLGELAAEITTLIQKDTKNAVAYYNDNQSRIGKYFRPTCPSTPTTDTSL